MSIILGNILQLIWQVFFILPLVGGEKTQQEIFFGIMIISIVGGYSNAVYWIYRMFRVQVQLKATKENT